MPSSVRPRTYVSIRASPGITFTCEPPCVRIGWTRIVSSSLKVSRVLGARRRVDHHRQVHVVEVPEPQQLALAAQELETARADLVESPLEVAALLGRHREEHHAARQGLHRLRRHQPDRRAHEAGAPHHVGPQAGQGEPGARGEAEAPEFRLDEGRRLPLLEAELGVTPDLLPDGDDRLGVALDRRVNALQLLACHTLVDGSLTAASSLSPGTNASRPRTYVACRWAGLRLISGRRYIGCVTQRTSCSIVKSGRAVSGATMSVNRYWMALLSSVTRPRSASERGGSGDAATPRAVGGRSWGGGGCGGARRPSSGRTP